MKSELGAIIFLFFLRKFLFLEFLRIEKRNPKKYIKLDLNWKSKS